MQTDTICAFQLEADDFFSESGEQFQVIATEDDGDFIELTVRELATDDQYTMTYAPFDALTLITSFEDDEVLDIPEFVE